MSKPSVFTQFFGMNLDVHGCGAGGDFSLVGGRIVCVLVRGCIVTSVGNFCEDVYPPDGVAIVAGWAVTGYGESARVRSSVPVPWGALGALSELSVCLLPGCEAASVLGTLPSVRT